MTLRDTVLAEPDPRVRMRLKAEHLRDLWAAAWPATGNLSITRRVGTQNWTILFDERPTLARDRDGTTIGIDAMVRVFRGTTELKVDPHRICINPPIMVPDGTTSAVTDPVTGETYQKKNYKLDPREAYLTWLVQTLRDNPNPKGWRTRGTVTTVYSTAPGGEGYVLSVNAVYATARSGGTLTAANFHQVGQRTDLGDYRCFEAFLIFDTSSIPDTDTVSGVVPSLYGNVDTSVTDFVSALGTSSYNGGAVVTTDWVAGASLPASLATWNSSGYVADYNAFTSAGAALNSAINKSGNTALILFSEEHRDNSTPTTNEYVRFTDADEVGTTTDPKLDITHAAPGPTLLSLGGTLTTAGVAGKSVSLSRTGSLSLAGAAAKLVSLARSGSMATAGSAVKLVSLTRSGSMASAGAVASILSLARSGALTTAGGIASVVSLARSGAMALAGAVAQLVGLARGGTLSPTGAATATTSLTRSGTLTPTGNADPVVMATYAVAGTLGLAGSIQDDVALARSGTLTTAGVAASAIDAHLGATLVTAGDVASTLALSRAGDLGTGGAIAASLSKALGGAASFAGLVAMAVLKTLGGELTTAGSIQTLRVFATGGTLALAGGVTKVVSKGLGGILALAGRAFALVFGPPVSTIDLTGSSAHTADLTGSYAPSLTIAGSSAATADVTGSMAAEVGLSGSSAPMVDLLGSPGRMAPS